MTISVPTSLELTDTNIVDDTKKVTRKSISANRYSSYLIDTQNNLYATGRNAHGELGMGDFENRNIYTNTGITNVKSVHATFQGVIIIKYDGTIMVCGDNSSGQLGLGTIMQTSIFVKVDITDVAQIITGDSTTAFAVKTDGSLWATGNNTSGQLGVGNTVDRNTFGDTTVRDCLDVYVGFRDTSIKKTDGTFWSTGKNLNGVLLLGDSTQRTRFTQITTFVTDIKKLARGYDRCFIMKTDGTLWAIGDNGAGNLGVGSGTTPKTLQITTMATEVVDLVSVLYDSVSEAWTLAIDVNGDTWGAGSNFSGQLGTGVTGGNETSFVNLNTQGVAINRSTIIDTDFNILKAGTNINGDLGLGNNSQTPSWTSSGFKSDTEGREDEYMFDGEIIQRDNALYTLTTYGDEQSLYYGFTYLSPIAPLKPFDDKNYTVATSASPMYYEVTGIEAFDTVALGALKAGHVSIVFLDPLGVQVGTTLEADVDNSRDILGNLAEWKTTAVYYAPEVMDAGSKVQITITGTSEIELGNILLGMSADAGFTNFTMTNKYKDFSVFEYDVFGNPEYTERAKISVYSGTVDILITNYDMTDRLMTSLGKNLVIINGSDSKDNTPPDGQNIFASTMRIGRIMSFVQQTQNKNGIIDQKARYSFTLEELA